MTLSVTVIIPVYNDSANLRLCYAALASSALVPDQVIVVDDGSTQPLPAPPPGLQLLALRTIDGPCGSYVARNLAAQQATSDLLVFVDADVAVHPTSIEGLVAYLELHPDVAAVFGSYDDTPAAPYWISRFKNLMHHYVHQHGRREAGTFWTGFGAVRRSAFEHVGGFRTDVRTLRDVDLGMRLRQAGMMIHLRPELQVTHLKRWTFRSMIRSDIVDRAIPWSRLIASAGALPDDLNLGSGSRWSAACAWLGILGLLGTCLWWPAILIGMVLWGVVVAMNVPLWRFMYAHGGRWFAAGAMLLFGLYLLYSSATLCIVLASAKARQLLHR